MSIKDVGVGNENPQMVMFVLSLGLEQSTYTNTQQEGKIKRVDAYNLQVRGGKKFSYKPQIFNTLLKLKMRKLKERI